MNLNLNENYKLERNMKTSTLWNLYETRILDDFFYYNIFRIYIIIIIKHICLAKNQIFYPKWNEAESVNLIHDYHSKNPSQKYDV